MQFIFFFGCLIDSANPPIPSHGVLILPISILQHIFQFILSVTDRNSALRLLKVAFRKLQALIKSYQLSSS